MLKRFVEYDTRKARLTYAVNENGLPLASTLRLGGRLLSRVIIHRLGYNSDMYRGL
jgi:hypothetical protein